MWEMKSTLDGMNGKLGIEGKIQWMKTQQKKLSKIKHREKRGLENKASKNKQKTHKKTALVSSGTTSRGLIYVQLESLKKGMRKKNIWRDHGQTSPGDENYKPINEKKKTEKEGRRREAKEENPKCAPNKTTLTNPKLKKHKKKPIQRPIIIKLLKLSDKKKILKVVREKKTWHTEEQRQEWQHFPWIKR